jgi:hypothetical protein
MHACSAAVVSVAPVLSAPQSFTASRKRGRGGGGGEFTMPDTQPGLLRWLMALLR